MIEHSRISPMLLLLLPLLGLGCLGRQVPEEMRNAIAAVRQRYAPDSRVAIFDLKPKIADGKVLIEGETNLPEALQALEYEMRENGLEVDFRVALLPSESLGNDTWGIVNVSVCNIRSQPKHAAELATQSTLGTVLRLYKINGDWFLVQTPDGYLGWLENGAFVRTDEAGARAWLNAPRVIVLPDYSLACAGPSPGEALSDLVAGNILRSGERSGTTIQVGFPDGRNAFVPAEEVADLREWMAGPAADQARLLATARRFMGRPYLWGGTSPKGMDCSGFTKTVYFLNGMILPRDASQQVHTGVEVPTDTTLANLQAGDFLFFGRVADDGRERITHVGIYLGEGQMIHAGADNPGVMIQSLRRGDPGFAEHRLLSLMHARRLTPGENGVQQIEDSPWY